MKHLFYLTIPALLFSCGGDATEESNEEVSTEEVSELDDTMIVDESVMIAEMSAEYIPENEDGLWQIDDYAQMMVGDKIYDSTNEIPEEDGLTSSYFEVKDLKGGYAKITGVYEGWSEFVLWRMKDGSDLIGKMTAGCGPVCDYSFAFSIYKDGQLVEKDASERVLPIEKILAQHDKVFNTIIGTYSDVPNDAYAQTVYCLPQNGTSMMVDMEIGEYEIRTHLLKLSWNKEKFTVEEYYNDGSNIMYK